VIGILFKPEMTLANLSGIKSRTSRTRGLQKINENPDDWNTKFVEDGIYCYFKNQLEPTYFIKCPYGENGNELYGKETYTIAETGYDENGNLRYSVGYKPIYKVDYQTIDNNIKWRSPMMMPEVASRYHIILDRIDCQRIQSITDQDCIKEGIIQFGEEFSLYPIDYDRPQFTREPRESFKSLLDTVNPDNWNRNLWNWALYYLVTLKQ
jgi:hypothetical protein